MTRLHIFSKEKKSKNIIIIIIIIILIVFLNICFDRKLFSYH